MVANTYSAEWFSVFLHNLSPAQTEREAEFVHNLLPPASLLLDVPCGSGRHAAHLASKGHQVVAVDRNPSLLGPSTLSLSWVAADMRALPLQSARLDAIVCLWQSFGYFSPDENAAVLREWSRVTRPGGLLVLDLYDPRFFCQAEGERSFEHGGRRIRETKWMQNDRLIVELAYQPGGGRDRFDWQLFTSESLSAVALTCGWEASASYAGFDPSRVPDGSLARAQHVLVRTAA